MLPIKIWIKHQELENITAMTQVKSTTIIFISSLIKNFKPQSNHGK